MCTEATLNNVTVILFSFNQFYTYISKGRILNVQAPTNPH